MSSTALVELAAAFLEVQVLAADGDVARIVRFIIHTFGSGSASELLRGSNDCLNLSLFLRFHAFVDIGGAFGVSLGTVHLRRR